MSKYLQNVLNCRDFSEARKILDENNIKKIDFLIDKHDYNTYIDSFDLLVKDFFKISEKNKILNILNFFNEDDFKIDKSENTHFPIEKLLEIKDNNENKKVFVIMNYIKELKYATEILEPLAKVFNSNSLNLKLTPRSENSFYPEIFRFNLNGRTLEIIEPGQHLKNPIYGLLHYINSDIELFKYRNINVNKMSEYEMNDSQTSYYSHIFNKLEIDGFKYKLEYDEFKKGKFSLYADSEEKTNPLLKIDFSKEFKLNTLLRDLYIKELLVFLNLNNSSINISINNDSYYICFNNSTSIRIEGNTSLLADLMNGITEEISLTDKIVSFFSLSKTGMSDMLTSRYFYENRNKILCEIKNILSK